MRLDGQNVVVFLAEDGRQILKGAGLNFPVAGGLAVQLELNDELGLWIRVQRNSEEHLVLVRWQYVLTIDIVPPRRAPIGLNR